VIEFHGASAVAQSTTIVHPTTVSLPQRRISIIGANGSGKSTLARMINGLVAPSCGSVTVRTRNGTVLDTVSAGKRVRDAVGFIFSDANAQLIMPTVLEDVALSLRKLHSKKADRYAAAIKQLNAFGLAELAQQSIYTLSGGQRQLLALATVLAGEPEVIVADEPTTLLDLHNATKISSLLLSLAQQVIIVTHDLELAKSCDRTLVIDRGQIVFDGVPSQAVSFYRELVLSA
jgi:biotin transport system ATP-binding protein